MSTRIFDNYGIEIFKEDNRFFVRYDAGAHMVVPRLDEMSQEEAELAMTGPLAAERVLFSVQKRLQATGVDPNKTNV